jgi:hypothetical protein
MNIKTTLKRVTPPFLWRPASNTYWWWRNRGQHLTARGIDPRWRESCRRVEAYRNSHLDERCFIIGNGPSLRQTDLSRLKGEFTFGLNRIYLMFPELGFTTSCLVVVNELVIAQSAAEMMALALPKFITWRARRYTPSWREFNHDSSLMYLDTDFTGSENFTGEATCRLYEGFTVTYAAMQLAFYMGFQEAILVGVDHNYVTQGKPNQAVISPGDDPNHFAPNYFGKGFKWQLPDLEGSERSYRMAKQAYEVAGRRLIDATVGGKLTIFPKVDYNSLFQ